MFCIYYSLFEYYIISFGFINTPVLCQYLINKTLYKYLDLFIIAYLNNILIYSKTETEYIKYIQKVFIKLIIVLFILEPEKYEFYKKELIFFGFVRKRNRIQIDLIKVETVSF